MQKIWRQHNNSHASILVMFNHIYQLTIVSRAEILLNQIPTKILTSLKVDLTDSIKNLTFSLSVLDVAPTP